MKTQILFPFHPPKDQKEEMPICEKYFPVTQSRVGIKDSLVIGRYSVLPKYREVENDLKIQGSKLINSSSEHEFIASFSWYFELEDMTPRTYFTLQDVPKNGGPFVLKGTTNSRKEQWKEKMFANNYQEAVKIYLELMNDPIISDQGVIIRDYVPLEDFGKGVNDQPFANEWRCFFYKDTLLSFGYYWVNGDVIPDNSMFDSSAREFVMKAADRVKEFCNYFVIDIAKTKDGKWIVIELNDAQMSGLSGNDPNVLYQNLKLALK